MNDTGYGRVIRKKRLGPARLSDMGWLRLKLRSRASNVLSVLQCSLASPLQEHAVRLSFDGGELRLPRAAAA